MLTRRPTPLALCLAALAACGQARAQCTVAFSTSPVQSTGLNDVNQLLVEDFDADGRLDLVLVHDVSAGVFIAWGKGDGTFDTPVQIHSGAARTAAVADMNADGLPDVVVREVSPVALRVILAGPGRTFTPMPAGAAAGASNFFALAVGDIDGDGLIDAAAIDRNNNTVRAFFGDGHGLLTAGVAATVTPPSGMFLQTLAVTDLDADGAAEVVVFATTGVPTGATRMTTLMFRNRAAELDTQDRVDLAFNLTQVGLADLDSDGVAEILGSYATAATAGGIATFQANGAGGLGDPVLAPVSGVRPIALASAEFNADGAPDAVGSNGGINILTNDGHGALSFLSRTFVSSSPRNIAAGDFNRDGKPDVIMLHEIAGFPLTIDFHENIGSAAQVKYLSDAYTVCPGGGIDVFMHKPGPVVTVRWENLQERGWVPLDTEDRVRTPAGELFGSINAGDTRFPHIQTVRDCCVSGVTAWIRAVATCDCGSTVGPPLRLSICRADINCDGFLDFFDSDQFVLEFEEGGGRADFNLDGFIDFFDLDAFIAAFEIGC